MFHNCFRFSSVAIVAIGLAWSSVWAAPPGGHLIIEQVIVDLDAETITITGKDFDFNSLDDLVVTLGDDVATPADITASCLNPLPTSDTIVCDLSGSGLPATGDYLLTVSTGKGQSQNDEYDLTIGTVNADGGTKKNGKYGLIGLTQSRTTGGAGGVGRLHDMCQQEFGSEARACTTPEAVKSPNLLSVTDQFRAWVQPVIASLSTGCGAVGGAVQCVYVKTDVMGPTVVLEQQPLAGLVPTRLTLSCVEWLSDSNDHSGTAVEDGLLRVLSCSANIPVLCCGRMIDS